jgi:hypothetical protein
MRRFGAPFVSAKRFAVPARSVHGPHHPALLVEYRPELHVAPESRPFGHDKAQCPNVADQLAGGCDHNPAGRRDVAEKEPPDDDVRSSDLSSHLRSLTDKHYPLHVYRSTKSPVQLHVIIAGELAGDGQMLPHRDRRLRVWLCERFSGKAAPTVPH